MKVGFFIAGMQKAGTTALDHFLRAHPSIQMAREKEPHFFDDDTVDWRAPDYDRLHRLYEPGEPAPTLWGEATPITLYWPGAVERVLAYNPEARFIVGLRHPTFRAFSHWRMETKFGHETLSFDEATSPPARERVRMAPGRAHRVFSYVERGFYADQIARLFRLVAPARACFYRTDRLWTEPETVLAEIQDFLGVERRLVAESRYIVPVDTSEFGAMPASARLRLDREFHRDIASTAALTGLDLSDWLAPRYEEPMRRAGSP